MVKLNQNEMRSNKRTWWVNPIASKYTILSDESSLIEACIDRECCEVNKLQKKRKVHTWPFPVSWFPKLPVCHARPSPLVSLRCWYSPRYRNHLKSSPLPLGLRMLKEEYNCSVSEIMTWPGQECRGWLKHDSDMSLAFQWVLRLLEETILLTHDQQWQKRRQGNVEQHVIVVAS